MVALCCLPSRDCDTSAATALLFHLRYLILKSRKCSCTICVVKWAHLCDETASNHSWYFLIGVCRCIIAYANTRILEVITRQQKCRFMCNFFTVCFKWPQIASWRFPPDPSNMIVHWINPGVCTSMSNAEAAQAARTDWYVGLCQYFILCVKSM